MERFVLEYVSDIVAGGRVSGARAAVRAGYSEKSADSRASKLLSPPDVAERVDVLVRRYWEAKGMSPEEVVGGLADIARTDMWSIVDPETGTVRADADGRLVRSVRVARDADGAVTTHVTTHDALKARETLARIQGLLDDRPQHNVALILAQIDDTQTPQTPPPAELFRRRVEVA
jgi:phage terminase small subunit